MILQFAMQTWGVSWREIEMTWTDEQFRMFLDRYIEQAEKMNRETGRQRTGSLISEEDFLRQHGY